MKKRYFFSISFLLLFFLLSSGAHAIDKYVIQTKQLTANDFDATLPKQPIESWLRNNIPKQYVIIWGDRITDCGESTGTDVDKDRNMPLCAEIEIRDRNQAKGYLALFVGTRDGGFFKEGFGIYHGYLEHNDDNHIFKQLRDLVDLK